MAQTKIFAQRETLGIVRPLPTPPPGYFATRIRIQGERGSPVSPHVIAAFKLSQVWAGVATVSQYGLPEFDPPLPDATRVFSRGEWKNYLPSS